ncbi:MAG: PHP domain-containing protein [bacterium]
MRIDIHVHTTFSKCGNFELDELCEEIEAKELRWVTVTDHGSSKACVELETRFPELNVVYGVEVTTREGDFLVYSPDSEHILSLILYAHSVENLRRGPDEAIIWAHPRGSSPRGWTAPSAGNEQVRKVMEYIDGIEIYNSKMMSGGMYLGISLDEYLAGVEALGKEFGKTLTGGSDAHVREHFMTCWTEFPAPPTSAEDFVAHIRSGNVRPGTTLVSNSGEPIKMEARG